MREELPEVVLTTTVSVDGRLTHAQIDATAMLEGSGSFVGPDAVAPRWPEPTVSDDVLWQDHLLTRDARWFVVADDRVDLRSALARIRSRLGATRVIADSGGTLNASLLREGLVDIVDVVTLPGLVDGEAVRTRYRVHPR